MPFPRGWNPTRALDRLLLTSFAGSVWRGHNPADDPLSHTGCLLYSGRYHRAPDLFHDEFTWPALYLALSLESALAESLRYLGPRSDLEIRYSEVSVRLAAVFDIRDQNQTGLASSWLVSRDLDVPQLLARAAREQGAEALIVPSAAEPTRWSNLVVFPDRLRAGAALAPTGEFFDPNFTRDR